MEDIDILKESVIIPELGVVKTDCFSKVYPSLNSIFIEKRESQESRNGDTIEFLNFKTLITNPYNRCVGGCKRNINIFFLLAEAMWIFTGRKDVKFLEIFNSKMVDFSDDGKVFHAPYGFRLRHWGIASESKFVEENMHASQGFDQVADIVKILSSDPNSRRAVLQIWNPDLDLGFESKDLPCNDEVFLKIRNGELHTTIANRSNDLHWGLPTNIFQFSFISEMIAACLGVKLGTQVHNSHSLHVYKWNNITNIMQESFSKGDTNDLYDISTSLPIDFNFSLETASNRLKEIDWHLNVIIDALTRYNDYKMSHGELVSINTDVFKFSKYLSFVFYILKLYIDYKKEPNKNDRIKEDFILKIGTYYQEEFNRLDISVLAENFFASRLSDSSRYEFKDLGKL